MNAALVIRTFYLSVGVWACLANYFPYLRKQYLAHGSRRLSSSREVLSPRKPSSIARVNSLPLPISLLDCLLTYQVPHVWFSHFYIISIISSIFWAQQILTRGAAFKALSLPASATKSGETMSLEQILLVWSLMAIQGCRRLFESTTINNKSSSTMGLPHYVLGIIYYISTGIAVWIEGSDDPKLGISRNMAPSASTAFWLSVFMLASVVQNKCHRYLASLPKYTLPRHAFFQRVVCPHYTAEVLIYLSMTFLAAPQGRWMNMTFLTMDLFVFAILGIGSEATWKWSADKFGPDKVAGRWRMLPYIW